MDLTLVVMALQGLDLHKFYLYHYHIYSYPDLISEDGMSLGKLCCYFHQVAQNSSDNDVCLDLEIINAS